MNPLHPSESKQLFVHDARCLDGKVIMVVNSLLLQDAWKSTSEEKGRQLQERERD